MTREEIAIQFAVNSESVAPGLRKIEGEIDRSNKIVGDSIIAAQKKSAAAYVDVWTAANKKRSMSTIEEEIALQERLRIIDVEAATRRNTARSLLRQRATGQAASAAERGVEMAAGSGGGAWMQKAVNAKKAEEALEEATGGMKAAGHAGTSYATALREAQVLVHEGLRGNFKRMIGSASILASSMGLLAPALLIVAGLAAIVGPSAWRTYKAFEESKQSGKDLDKKTGDQVEPLKKTVDELNKIGKISDKQAEEYRRQLEHPTYENVSAIMGATNKLIGGDHKSLEKTAREFDEQKRLDEEHLKNVMAIGHVEQTGFAKWQNDQYQRLQLVGQLQNLEKGSIAYKQKILEIDQKDKEIAEDKASIDKAAAENAAARANLKSEFDLHTSEIHQHEMDKFLPTLQELHHGKFSGTARQIERLDKKIKRDFEHGNLAGATADIATRNKDYDSLVAKGVIAERPEVRELKDLKKQFEISMAKLGTSKNPFYTKPAMTGGK